jgi:hypothetical protein
LIVTVVDVFAGRVIADALHAWRDRRRVTENLQSLLHASYLDDDHRIPEKLRHTTAAGLTIVITELSLDGLVPPVYFLEVTRPGYDLAHAHYLRHFCYDSAANRLWYEQPAGRDIWQLPMVCGWTPLCPVGRNAQASAAVDDRRWFMRQPTFAESAMSSLGPMAVMGIYRRGQQTRRGMQAYDRIQDIAQGHLFDQHSKLQATPGQPFIADGLEIWATPLASAQGAGDGPQRTLIYHLVVINPALGQDDPVRAVAALYDRSIQQLRLLLSQ